MFTIIPYERGQLPNEIGIETSALWESLVPDTQLCDLAKRPFLQFSHEEIPEEDVEVVLGYAGITKANAPVGLPCNFEPQWSGRDCLLFPLSELENHLHRTQPALVAEYEGHRSLDQFLESREIPAREYLVVGLLECIKWCFKHRAALTIRW